MDKRDINELLRLVATGREVVNSTGAGGWSALHLAAFRSDFEMVEILLKHNADVTLQTNEGATALYLSIWKGDLQIVKLLVSASVQTVDISNKNAATPLFIACQLGLQEIAELLHSFGASVHSKNKNE